MRSSVHPIKEKWRDRLVAPLVTAPPSRSAGVDQSLCRLLAVRLGGGDVPPEDSIVDHFDPGAVVVIEDGVLDGAVRGLADAHQSAELLVYRALRIVDLGQQVVAHLHRAVLRKESLSLLICGPLDEVLGACLFYCYANHRDDITA